MERYEALSQQQAFGLLRGAAELDVNYPLPLVAMAQSLLHSAMLGIERPSAVISKAKAFLERALQLDPEYAEAHAIMGNLITRHEWTWALAEQCYLRALVLAPNSAAVHNEFATEFLAPMARFEEALSESQIARQLDPFSPRYELGYPWILLHQGEFLKAEHEYRKLLDFSSGHAGLYRGLALALTGQNRITEATGAYEAAYGLDSSTQNGIFVAMARAQTGDPAPARKLLAEAERNCLGFIPFSDIALLHIGLGDIDRAFLCLELARENREHALLYLKTCRFFFGPLSIDPRYEGLMRRVGFD
jgi:tetratricopeptide (TPR) repeat protein